MLPDLPHAVLALADGTVFRGHSIGAPVRAVGEVVFNTAMTGYQEILTDPSYCRQLVTLTYPHIGNTGVNAEDVESGQIHAEALIIRDLPAQVSNFRATQSLSDYLVEQKIAGIAGIDTRALTRHLRDHGAQPGCLIGAGPGQAAPDVEQALQAAQSFDGLAGLDLARVVSTDKPYDWTDGTWKLDGGYQPGGAARFTVVAMDFGVKHNILRLLADRGCTVHVLPAQSTIEQVLALKPDGLFLSNGPGDPEPCEYAIAMTREALDRGLPTFGICLGHQILALACGASTLKMKSGHHGANHPVKDMDTGNVHITSQNHGFAVDGDSLPGSLRQTHLSLFDSTVQGIAHTEKPAFGFQGHPEASPGPHDIQYLFDRFVQLMVERKPVSAS